MKKKLLAAALAAIMTLTPAAAYASASNPAATESVVESVAESAAESVAEPVSEIPADAAIDVLGENIPQTDMKLGIEREYQVMEAAGMDMAAWDEMIATAAKEGAEEPFTEEDFSGDDLRRDGETVYYIGESEKFGTAQSEADVYRLLYRLLPLFGAKDGANMMLWSKLRMNDLTVYSFQELSGEEAVLGSTVKIALNADGTVSAVFNSLDQEERKVLPVIGREEAEQVVADYESKNRGHQAEILSDSTERNIRNRYLFEETYLGEGPSSTEELPEEEDDEELMGEQAVWTVYTANKEENAEYPYLAHYVLMDGSYLNSLPVREIGDIEARTGYRKQAVFEGMVPETWTGKITGVDGREKYVQIPVMRSEKDGKYYLGDISRKVVVADYWEVAYGDHSLHVISTDNNEGWDDQDLFMYYNYIRAWDFYDAAGWHGPDGLGTDVVILKGLCYRDRTPFVNAASFGLVQNWQVFGYCITDELGEKIGLVDALDVMAHEYTHTFTGTVMNANLYKNDLGAVNEAMSDIMGNLIEYSYGDTTDAKWLLGENTGETARSMSDPAEFEQPSYVWDVFYGPHADEMSETNDNGGVHTNSSLLNRIAALLCINHGMSCREASNFWMAAAMGMTPLASYPRIEALLEWAMKVSGTEKYSEPLHALIAEEHLGRTELPEKLRPDQKLIKLRLPDTKTFEDKNWVLFSLQLNSQMIGDVLSSLVSTGLGLAAEPGEANRLITSALRELAERLKIEDAKVLLEEKEEITVDQLAELGKVIARALAGKLLIQQLSWEERGSREITMISRNYPGIYVLLNMNDGGARLNGLAVLIGDHWYDLGSVVNVMDSIDKQEGELDEEQVKEIAEKLANSLIEALTKSSGTEETSSADDAKKAAADAPAMSEEEDGFTEILEALGRTIKAVSAILEGADEATIQDLLSVPTKAEYLPEDGLEDVRLFSEVEKEK